MEGNDRKAIVIGSTTRTQGWLQNCLNSFGNYKKYPIIVVVNDDFEMGKINWIYKYTSIDKFFLLHDTVEIKDTSIFDMAFEFKGSYALSTQPVWMGMFLGTYRREVLNNMTLFQTTTKLEAVNAEITFNNDYYNHETEADVCPEPLVNTEVFEEKFGRKNMVLENKWIKKYKGTWTLDMAKNI